MSWLICSLSMFYVFKLHPSVYNLNCSSLSGVTGLSLSLQSLVETLWSWNESTFIVPYRQLRYRLSTQGHNISEKSSDLFIYLNPQRLHGWSRRRQVLQLPRPLVRKHRPRCFVLSVPLDRPAAVQEVSVWGVASQSQEVSGFSHLLDADVPRSFWDQPDVHVAWRTDCCFRMKNLLWKHSNNVWIKSYITTFLLK